MVNSALNIVAFVHTFIEFSNNRAFAQLYFGEILPILPEIAHFRALPPFDQNTRLMQIGEDVRQRVVLARSIDYPVGTVATHRDVRNIKNLIRSMIWYRSDGIDHIAESSRLQAAVSVSGTKSHKYFLELLRGLDIEEMRYRLELAIVMFKLAQIFPFAFSLTHKYYERKAMLAISFLEQLRTRGCITLNCDVSIFYK